MSLELEDKTAVVTGAGSGIGRQTAKRFADEGANVVVADIDEDGGRTTVDMVESADGDATFVRADVTEPDDIQTMVDTAVETYGGLDMAHNNAGIEGNQQDDLADQSRSDWAQVIDINLTGVWECLRQEIRTMEANGGGAIVNTSSIAGLTAGGTAPYVASKHGVVGLTRAAASEYADADIRVNAVCPGVIDTPMVDRAEEADPEELQQFVQMQPMGRKGRPEEIANAVVWLCSDEASFVTGNAYPVDGGYMAL
ncbi:MAG: NAD(P)-dependent dehydrogenase (short-subunit alcohol dehydrogenase family) [Natronomonas sp.]|jgi:NAD(P)-dependent dehydrogenase (short-subunit alcohol dehydrogenase family)